MWWIISIQNLGCKTRLEQEGRWPQYKVEMTFALRLYWRPRKVDWKYVVGSEQFEMKLN